MRDQTVRLQRKPFFTVPTARLGRDSSASMSTNAQPSTRRRVKRRRVNTTDTIEVARGSAPPDPNRQAYNAATALQAATSSPSLPNMIPVSRPPEAPFYPGAIEMWVVRDANGQKRLVSERVPGYRHWRIGDPNMSTCFECNKGGNLVGCRTCKRSYHIACLKERASEELVFRRRFHCPLCIERGWDEQPPPEILPLTAPSSRSGSPDPPSRQVVSRRVSGAGDEPTNMPRLGRGDGGGDGEMQNDPNQPYRPSHPAQAEERNQDHESDFFNPEQDSTPTASDAHPIIPQPIRVSHPSWAPSLPATSSTHPSRRHEWHESAFPETSDDPDGVKLPASKRRTKRSRYQTMESDVDLALTTIYREIERVQELRLEIRTLQDELKISNQERQMLQGRVALERSTRGESIAQRDAEIESLKKQLDAMTRAHNAVVHENKLLAQRIEDNTTTQAKLEEMQALKIGLRRLLGD
ncbi:hypothetical protein PV08_08517 [Exophiala spinifera]|uniref:PHD-type domain-containing protein n=1 Tax=Exophiala spinifera TaxID=91928 RepID=A0A0D2BQB7_9EURO|nr:uncharacterized protein PV08_08517 [Exophiala spinifera]KIW13329.1 hypothetical protein PV08_08517 [Exophiala spinifera]